MKYFPIPKFSISVHKTSTIFLKLKKFLSRKLHTDIINASNRVLKFIIQPCLQGMAKEWWSLVSGVNDNFNTVGEKFIETFWNEEIRFKNTTNLQFGGYNPNGKLSRSAYAIKVINKTKNLIPPPSKSEFFSKMSRYFEEDIKTVSIIRNINNINDLLDFLEKFSQAGSIDSQINFHNQGQRHLQFNLIFKLTFIFKIKMLIILIKISREKEIKGSMKVNTK